MKYNYVIFGSWQENYLYSFHDIEKMSNAIYIYDIHAILGWKTPLFYTHICKKANRYFPLPFKSIWNRQLFNKNPFSDDKPLCFVFFGIWENMIVAAGFGDYLKRRFKGAKTVLFLQDILAKSHSMYSDDCYDAEELKALYDYVISYDKRDCEKYGFIYHPTVFSVPDLPADNDFPETDVYFLGLAKNRFTQITDIYDKLTEEKIKCDFFVAGVPEDKRIKREGIHYISQMSYTENLQRISKSKCILELMQEGAQGYTFRLWEAIVMNKKLLSNNSSLKDSHFYNENYIKVYHSENNNLSSWILDTAICHNSFVEKISPKELLIFIDKIL